MKLKKLEGYKYNLTPEERRKLIEQQGVPAPYTKPSSYKGAIFKCEKCGKEFYVTRGRINHTSKKGIRIRFCSRKCYDKHGSNNPFYGKKHSEDLVKKHKERMRIHPPSGRPLTLVRWVEQTPVKYSLNFNSKHNIKKMVKKCELCGFDKDYRILIVHHKDGNRQNGSDNNLLVLCPTCHSLQHLRPLSHTARKDNVYHP